jgi:hypothetical protein
MMGSAMNSKEMVRCWVLFSLLLLVWILSAVLPNYGAGEAPARWQALWGTAIWTILVVAVALPVIILCRVIGRRYGAKRRGKSKPA